MELKRDLQVNTNLWEDVTAWLDDELAACVFRDVRLGRRLRLLVGRLWNGLGETIPLMCQDWANTKTAYRSSLAVTTEELPLGLAAIKFCSRGQFKGCNALKRTINPTRVPVEQKESIR